MRQVRLATIEDAESLARLSADLGYPASGSTIRDRLAPLLASPAHLVIVAEDGQQVLGWAGAEARMALESEPKVEITGIVVDAVARNSGTGRMLIAAIENWAIKTGHKTVVVRSNITRGESHSVYEKLGYERIKSQHVYRRALDS
jgi:GNAT superfamily N-acetyltransferase